MTPNHPSLRMWLLLCAVVILQLSSSFLSAAPPPFYEPKEHYYRAQGRGVEVRWEVDRTELPADGDLTATLVVTGDPLIHPEQIVRPDLKTLRDFESRFQVVDVPGPPVPPNAKEVRFAYRLRPRNTAVDRLPSLPFVYVNPDAPEARRFMTTKAAGIDLRVTAPPPTTAPAVPLDAPEHLFHITTGPRVLEQEPFTPGVGLWVAMFVVGPVVAGVWLAAWRRLYPDAARLARLRRSRAARRALDAIRKAGRTPDRAGAVAAAVLGYLRARYPLGPGADTPTDIGRELLAAGLAESEADAVVGFFRRCDEARFAPASEGGLPLAADAAAVVTRLEAVA